MRVLHYGIPALSLFLTWIIYSGHYDPFHLSLGIFSVALVLIISRKLFATPEQDPKSGINTELLFSLCWKSALAYPFVLLLNILTANLKVAAIILDPKMPIDPMILTFKTKLTTDAAKIVLGNSITLTPGTITLDIQQETFFVHALNTALAESLIAGEDQNRVAQVFGDEITDKWTIDISRGEEWNF